MIIKKYSEFIYEDKHDTPESEVSKALLKIKNKMESYFSDENVNSVKSLDSYNNGKKKEEGELTLSDLGVNLESSEISKYSKVQDLYKLKFSDENHLYDIAFIVDLQNALKKEPAQGEEEKESKKVNKAYIRFKKYSLIPETPELIGEISKDNVKIDDIDEEFLINLKIEIDEEFPTDDETIEFDV